MFYVSYVSVSTVFFFFFKQKTAYEIYQCDWSSDVCSSDLERPPILISFSIALFLGLSTLIFTSTEAAPIKAQTDRKSVV